MRFSFITVLINPRRYTQTDICFLQKSVTLAFQFVKDATGKPLKMIVKERGAVADELVFEK